jgi:RNA polymerase sigma-70 factor (ECF subfamily)
MPVNPGCVNAVQTMFRFRASRPLPLDRLSRHLGNGESCPAPAVAEALSGEGHGGIVLRDRVEADSFTEFVREVEPRLRHALIAGFGLEAAQEATAEAMAYGWEHWGRISRMDNPAGYLYRVGQTRARRASRRNPLLPLVPQQELPWIEPSLPSALARLSRRQRTVVWLVHGLSWQYTEVAELLGISADSARTHDGRGLAKLRAALGGDA